MASSDFTTRHAAVVAALLAGCAPWTVVLQGAALPTTPRLAVVAPTFDEPPVGEHAKPDLVQPTAEALAARCEDERAFGEAFTAAVLADRGTLDVTGADDTDGRLLVHARVKTLTPGERDGLFTAPTKASLRITITDAARGPTKRPVDEIELHCAVAPDGYRPTVRERVVECAKEVGRDTARYLRQRLR